MLRLRSDHRFGCWGRLRLRLWLLGDWLGRWLWLWLWLGFRLTNQALTLGLATQTIGLRLNDAGGVTLHPDAESIAKIEDLLIGHPHFSCELIDTDFCWHE